MHHEHSTDRVAEQNISSTSAATWSWPKNSWRPASTRSPTSVGTVEELQRYARWLDDVTPPAIAINLQTFRTDYGRRWLCRASPGWPVSCPSVRAWLWSGRREEPHRRTAEARDRSARPRVPVQQEIGPWSSDSADAQRTLKGMTGSRTLLPPGDAPAAPCVPRPGGPAPASGDDGRRVEPRRLSSRKLPFDYTPAGHQGSTARAGRQGRVRRAAARSRRA